jgi:hypothetical protein
MLNEDALAIKTEYGNLTLDAYWYVSLYAYQMNTRPVFELVSGMLRKALAKLGGSGCAAATFGSGLAIPDACLPAIARAARSDTEYVAPDQLLR